jgi:hypothetical protein
MSCPISITEQLMSMPRSGGWLDGSGEPVSTLTVMRARREINERCPDITPYLYPTEDGGISVEWDDNGGGQFKVEPIAAPIKGDELPELLAHLAAMRGGDE